MQRLEGAACPGKGGTSHSRVGAQKRRIRRDVEQERQHLHSVRRSRACFVCPEGSNDLDDTRKLGVLFTTKRFDSLTKLCLMGEGGTEHGRTWCGPGRHVKCKVPEPRVQGAVDTKRGGESFLKRYVCVAFEAVKVMSGKLDRYGFWEKDLPWFSCARKLRHNGWPTRLELCAPLSDTV